MLEEPKVKTCLNPTAAAVVCGENGWAVGDLIVPDGFLGRRRRITAIGEQSILARDGDGHEAKFERLQGNDWRRVVPDPEPPDLANQLAAELEKKGFGPGAGIVYTLRHLNSNRADAIAAIQAIIDREKAKGGAIEWVDTVGGSQVATFRGRAAQVWSCLYGVWRYTIHPGNRMKDTSYDSRDDAKAAAEAALRKGAGS